MCNITDKYLRYLNFAAYSLVILTLILRVILSDEEDNGIGNTPTFLFVLQCIMTILILASLVMGELRRTEDFIICYPLELSRTKRGIIILIIALTLTNF